MKRFMHWLLRRAGEGGICLGLACGGLFALAQEAPVTPAAKASAEELQKWLGEILNNSERARLKEFLGPHRAAPRAPKAW